MTGQFQFLIGRLQTYFGVNCADEYRVFQFLIGRLQTNDSYRRSAREQKSFNSS